MREVCFSGMRDFFFLEMLKYRNTLTVLHLALYFTTFRSRIEAENKKHIHPPSKNMYKSNNNVLWNIWEIIFKNYFRSTPLLNIYSL